MKVIGIEKSSFIDYPGKICTVYFTPGCNFRCAYCHNSPAVMGKGELIKEEEILLYLEKRKKFIDAVCISGGEPTLQEDLDWFIEKLKSKGFFIKLDTNGTNPDILQKLLDKKLIDYVAMDIKGPLYKYSLLAGIEVAVEPIKESINIIKNSNIDYEFRTTICKELLSPNDIRNIANLLKGSRAYYLQNFKDGDTILAGKGKLTPYSMKELKLIEKEIKDYFVKFDIR